MKRFCAWHNLVHIGSVPLFGLRVAAGLLQRPAGAGRPAEEGRELAYEDLTKLTYLNAVIDEAMRMYPVGATASVRECTK